MVNTTTTYYEILEVDRNADGGAIRKAYLKASLKHHPDKNPDNVDAAKAQFVQIGQAYEVLSDPQKRAVYDRELRSGRAPDPSSFNNNYYYDNNNSTTTPSSNQQNQDQYYENYRDFFDANVAGMSEAELAAAIGTVAAVAGVVGSIVGSKMMRGSGSSSSRGGGAGSSFLSAAGSMVGSMVASELAASSVRALHQQSIGRVAYKEECRRCVERGEPMPDPPPSSSGKVEEVFQKAVDVFKGVTQNEGTRRSVGNLWQKAKEGVRQASSAAANSNNTGGRKSGGSGV